MKRFLILAAAFMFMAAAFLNAAETNEVFRIDFEQAEGYTVGDIFTQEKGWRPYSATQSNCYGRVVDTETFACIKSGTQALLAGVQDTSFGQANFCVDFDLSSIDIDKNYVQFEMQVKPSEAGSGAYASRFQINSTNNVMLCSCLVFNKGFWSSTYSMKTGANAWAFNPGSAQGGPEKIEGMPAFDEFTTVTWTWDLGKQQLLSCQYGEETCFYTNRWDPETGAEYEPNANIPYGINPQFSGLPARLIIAGQNERPEAGYDAFVVRTITKPQTSNPGKLNCAATTLVNNYKSTSTSTAFTITNDGDEPFDFTVSTDSEWLVPVATNGTCTSAATINLTLDREKMTENKYYRSIVNVDAGEAGSCQVRVTAQGPYIYFSEDFESPYMIYGGIVATQDRWDNNMQPSTTYNIVVTNAYGREGIGFINQTAWYDGQTISVDSRDNEIIHVGMDMYIPMESQTTEFHFKSSYWSLSWDLVFAYAPESGVFRVKGLNNNELVLEDWEGSMDEWIRVELVIDYQAQIVKSVKLGDNEFNDLGIELMKDTNDKEVTSLSDLSIYATPQENLALIGLDNIIAEEVERTGDPQLVAPAFQQFGADSKGTFVIRNAGAGSFEYTVEAIDNTDCFTFDPASGSVEGKKEINVTINREDLSPGFYRSRIVSNGGAAGSVTSIFTFACGGVYYTCDFEEPWFKNGSIRGQETWSYDPDVDPESFEERVEDGVLSIMTAPGYVGLRADVVAPNAGTVTVHTAVFCPSEGVDGGTLFFKQNDAWPYAEFMITRDSENEQMVLRKSGVEEEVFSMTAPLDEWVPFSYTFWFDDQTISEVTFGEETVNPQELFIENETKAFTRYIVCASEEANFQIDDVMISEYGIVPEPACLALLALVAAAFLRRK
ncbi:hypothetical protein IKW72_03380 [bacterium]|nr:hypothetical protein [bacterium]